MGEVDYAPGEPKGTPWHPHRGFETVTYMIDGTFEHQDSNGGGGVDHERRHPVDDRRRRDPPHREAAGVARRQRRPVPRDPALGEPAARPEVVGAALPGPRASEVALVSSPDGGALVRVIAGEVAGHAGPGSTYSPMTLVHATLVAGRPAEPALAGRLQRARLRAGRVRDASGRRAADPDGPARGLRRRATRSVDGRPIQESRSPTLDVLSSAAARSASRSPGWARS